MSSAREFAPEAVPGRKKRRFFIPAFDEESWLETAGPDFVTIDASCVDRDKAICIGSLDVGTVAMGWSIVEFAPLIPSLSASSSSESGARERWIRMPKPAKAKNVDLGSVDCDWHPFAFRLVKWSFETLVASGTKLTKEQAVTLATTTVFRSILSNFAAHRVSRVIVE